MPERFGCDICPRRCQLKPGQRGYCYVRGVRQAGARGLGATERGVELLTYGRSSGFCIDPIEKKPLNHFLPGTSVLSFGTAGCNLGCKFCQNWSVSKARAEDALQVEASPTAIAEAARKSGCRSVAFTYNDPVIFYEYAIDTAAACRDLDVAAIAVTAGYITAEARPAFFAAMDAVNVDLKAFTERFYEKLCAGRLEVVKDTLRYVAQETDTWLEVTTLLIPNENDSDDEIDRMTRWFAATLGTEVPLHFSAFHPDFRMQATPRTPIETLRRAREIARANGLRYVYTGNVHDPAGETTFCPGCGGAVVERDRYRIDAYRMSARGCNACGGLIAGRFEDQAGAFGRRRIPLRMA